MDRKDKIQQYLIIDVHTEQYNENDINELLEEGWTFNKDGFLEKYVDKETCYSYVDMCLNDVWNMQKEDYSFSNFEDMNAHFYNELEKEKVVEYLDGYTFQKEAE